jgi:hypothetical protein
LSHHILRAGDCAGEQQSQRGDIPTCILLYNLPMQPTLIIDPNQIAAFCQQRHIQRMLLFGSALRADIRPDSDIDILVEFEPGHTPGWEFFGWADDLAELLGHPVDLGTPDSLSRFIRDQALASAQVIYERSG